MFGKKFFSEQFLKLNYKYKLYINFLYTIWISCKTNWCFNTRLMYSWNSPKAWFQNKLAKLVRKILVQAYLLTRLVTQTSTNQQYSNTPYNLFKNHIPNPKRLTSYPFLETYPPPKKKKKKEKKPIILLPTLNGIVSTGRRKEFYKTRGERRMYDRSRG